LADVAPDYGKLKEEMNPMQKKSLIIIVTFLSLIGLFSAADAKINKKIGFIIFSEEVRYDGAKRGIVDQLKEDGFAEPKVTYLIANAKGSKAKATEAIQKFSDENLDLIIAMGTSATLVAIKIIKDTPIVFSTVYNPVESGIAKDLKSSGNNTTGVTTWFPLSKIMVFMKEFAPVKTMAVLYTPEEKNTVAQLLELQKNQAESQIKVIPIIISSKEDLTLMIPEAVRVAKAIYLTGSSLIGHSIPFILKESNRSKVITVTHLDDLVQMGALLGMGVDSYSAGRQAGRIAGKILKGAKPSSIPIEAGEKINSFFNMRTAKAGRFNIPPAFMKKVTKVIE
jgi:putative tryptophan/tyrosine transport system substrate-binding protein